MTSPLMHEIYNNLLRTATAFVALTLTYFVINLLISRKFDSIRQKRRARIRIFYVTCLIFLFLIARIWVEGFTHLLTMLGLVSAALVVTNKETIMNFVGWLVITWRGLFAEDDLIQIQQYKGYVKSIGLLYFKLLESSNGRPGDITGRVIRVPNGLTANNALINFSQTSHLLEQEFTIKIKSDSDIEYTMRFLQSLVNGIIAQFYKNKKEYSIAYLNKKNKDAISHLKLQAKVSMQPNFDKSTSIDLTTRYYCFSIDAEKIQQQIWLKLFHAVRTDQQVKISCEV